MKPDFKPGQLWKVKFKKGAVYGFVIFNTPAYNGNTKSIVLGSLNQDAHLLILENLNEFSSLKVLIDFTLIGYIDISNHINSMFELVSE